ncbi:hypothetical protein ASPWEDRAFT_114702 [Aspergillus wentii DTO 134E9]|uniref:Serine peptidase, family S28 n=1 Tax=Aspergillus wentii DTO 134E9 TaxID=1073089 RepID=A0A1L9RE85_ASPWE|nr:uncharacterized protein ASPWEDRAFT_114702 [Aspergillus wentii DTO 134E9]OJJ33236.1 hypothetical protein ASPWEDRAFT_114702 [Aspergillus wentii DTO 134E9]
MYIPSVVVVGLLSQCVAGIGLSRQPLAHELQLSAQLGVDPNLLWKDREAFHKLVSESIDSDIPTEYATIPIDHNDSSVGTYQNRYWVTEDFYVPGGPVFVYDVGEADAEKTAKVYLTNTSSFFRNMLEEFHGLGIGWEHRYYGESLPYPVSLETPPEHFKYHTTRQALADLPYLAQNFSSKAYPDVDVTPKSTPWIMVGGSYAGIRAALSRKEYPDVFHAAFASSAPVQARVNMTMYFDQVYRGMNKYGFDNCTKDIHSALEYIDDQLSKNDTAATIKKAFLGEGAEKNTNGDFTAGLAGIFHFFQNYGTGGDEGSLEAFCDYIEYDPETKSSAGPDGLASIYGSKYVAERWASWPVYIPLVNLNSDTNCNGQNESIPLSCDLGKPPSDPNGISWSWQYCSEWGYFQSNNVGPHSLLSKYQTLEYQQEICNRVFSSAAESDLLPSQPQANSINADFGGWTMRPSNVYWSGGEFDPWRTLSPLSTEDIAPQGISFTTEIPECDVQTSENTLFGYILEDSEHCFDFRLNSIPGTISRGIFTKALTRWLSCFKGRA